MVVEILLQLLVGEVDTQLLKVIELRRKEIICLCYRQKKTSSDTNQCWIINGFKVMNIYVIDQETSGG